MSTSTSTRVATVSMLLAGAGCLAPAFLPVARSQADATGLLRRAAVALPASGAAEPSPGMGVLAPIGLAALACAAVGVAGKQRRTPATLRRFFGEGAAAPPKKPTSYKDYSDPWLGSADLSFDPLNLAVQGGIFDRAASAVPETTYYNYRESEVKHGRFAMVAFLSIFAEAADRNALLHQIGNVSIEDKLDGTLGLDEVQAPVLLVGLGYQALAEYNLQQSEKDGNFLSVEYKKERIPGDLGFDPLGLAANKSADKKGLHNIEVNTGRLAMIGVTTFLFKEFVIKDAAIASKIL